MADTTRDIADRLTAVALTAGLEWEGFGQPSSDDFFVVIESVADYLEQYDGPVAMETPATGVKVDRDEDGLYNVYFRVGSFERINDGDGVAADAEGDLSRE